MPVGDVRGDPARSACRGSPFRSCSRRVIFEMPRTGGPRDRPLRLLTLRRSGRVAEGGALLRRYVGEHLHRGFESLLLRSGPSGPQVEGWQSGRMRRSRKPLSVVRRIEGSNPSPSGSTRLNPASLKRDSGRAALFHLGPRLRSGPKSPRKVARRDRAAPRTTSPKIGKCHGYSP